MILSEGKLDIFYTSPAAMVFFSFALLVIGLQFWSSLKPKTMTKVGLVAEKGET
jgi:predicted small integral membrane protein